MSKQKRLAEGDERGADLRKIVDSLSIRDRFSLVDMIAGRNARYYGSISDGDDRRTIHGSELVNVEVDSDGKVVSVWFRCALLPFSQHAVNTERASEMRRAYKTPPSRLFGIVHSE